MHINASIALHEVLERWYCWCCSGLYINVNIYTVKLSGSPSQIGYRAWNLTGQNAEVSQGWNESLAWDTVRVLSVDQKNWPTTTETRFWEVRLKAGSESKEIVTNFTPGVQSSKVRCWNGCGRQGRQVSPGSSNSSLLARHQVNTVWVTPPPTGPQLWARSSSPGLATCQ